LEGLARVLIKRPLVIAIDDPNWFMKTLALLRKRNISFTIYDDISKTPYYSILYTDHAYYVEKAGERRDITIYYDPEHTCRVFEKAVLATMFKEEYDEVVIGVDPGPTLHVVVIGDNELVDYESLSTENILDYIVEKLDCLPSSRRIIRIGGGYNGWDIVLKIKGCVDAKIEIVDENETTPKSSRRKLFYEKYLRSVWSSKDLYAALRIAFRKGIEVS